MESNIKFLLAIIKICNKKEFKIQDLFENGEGSFYDPYLGLKKTRVNFNTSVASMHENIKLQKLNSGSVACLYRNENPNNRGVSLSISKDGGGNWSYHGQIYSAPKDAKHLPYYKCGYPDLIYLNKTEILGVLHTYPDEDYCMEIHQFLIRDRT